MFGGVGRALEVDTITIEAICDQHKINKINLLKIDTEGHDLAVLQGARRLVKDKVIDIIEFEFVPACIATKVNMVDFCELLNGYRICRLGLNGQLIDISPYDYRFREIYAMQHLIAIPENRY